jgi:hypothetical protein
VAGRSIEELVAGYPSRVVAIHRGRVVFTGDSEVEVYQWVRKSGLVPVPLVFRVPRGEDRLFGNCRGIGCKNLLLVPLSR